MSQNPQDEHVQGIKKSIENIIGSDTVLKRRKKNENDINRHKFEQIIVGLEQMNTRSQILSQIKVDMSSYEDVFYNVIESIMEMFFSKEELEVINFYVYDRINPDGSINHLLDKNNKDIPLTSIGDLWDLILFIRNQKGNNART